MSSRGKSGVAVIIVLGVLALLMVLGVSFSITMRVERAGAANYVRTVRSRQLLQAGLARAIDHIHTVSTNSMYPGGDFLASRADNPDGNPTYAGWGVESTNGPVLGRGQARQYLPEIINALYFPGDGNDLRAGWVEVGGTNDTVGGGFAYLVLNCSDMIDVNHLSYSDWDDELRLMDRTLLELGFPQSDIDALRDDVATYGPFQSLAEFRSIVTDATNDYYRYFVVGSRYPEDNNATNRVFIGMDFDVLLEGLIVNDPSALAVKTNITWRLQAPQYGIGLNALAANRVFTNLVNYAITDTIPTDLDGPYTKAVPMLNEVAADYALVYAIIPPATNVVATFRVRAEWVYPFVNPPIPNHSYSVNGDYSWVVSALDTDPPISYTNTGTLAVGPLSLSGVTGNNGYQEAYFAATPPGAMLPGASPTNTFTWDNLTVSNLHIRVFPTGNPSAYSEADRTWATFAFVGPDDPFVPVPAPPPGTPLPYQPMKPDVPGPGVEPGFSYQALDPRMNWNASVWFPFLVAPETFGGTNEFFQPPAYTNPLTIFRSEGAPFLREWDDRMYVSSRGQLYSPLELGNLLLGQDAQHWQTFRVFNQSTNPPSQDRHRLLENFTTRPVGEVGRGLLNLNTRDNDLRLAALSGLPTDFLVGGTVTAGEAQEINTVIASQFTNGGSFTNLTDVLNLNWRTGVLADVSDMRLESLAAFVTSLFGVRQNLYTILIGSSTGAGTVGMSLDQRAVAVLWRDPIADASGRHQTELLLYKVLE